MAKRGRPTHRSPSGTHFVSLAAWKSLSDLSGQGNNPVAADSCPNRICPYNVNTAK
jgi:hypothetical protein